MSFFNIWINDQLSATSYTINNFFHGPIDNYNKWIPDNNLVLRHNKYLNNCAELNRLKYIVEYALIPKSKRLIKEFMKKSRSYDPDDRTQVSNIRKEMSIIEKKISTTEDSIKQLENYDLLVVEEWNKYLEKAKIFLESNNINSEITMNDILSEDRLYIICKKILNNYILDVKSNKYLNIIKDITQFFDITCSFKNTPSLDFSEYEKKLKELLNFETKNSLNAIKIASKLFLYDIDNNPISYELNINNDVIELSDDIITVLCEEYNTELTN